MAQSTGLILTAGAITFGNEWLQSGKPNWRVVVATFGSAAVFAGLEKLDEPAAVGLAAIAVLTVLIGGVNPAYKSPAQEVLSLLKFPAPAAAGATGSSPTAGAGSAGKIPQPKVPTAGGGGIRP